MGAGRGRRAVWEDVVGGWVGEAERGEGGDGGRCGGVCGVGGAVLEGDGGVEEGVGGEN